MCYLVAFTVMGWVASRQPDAWGQTPDPGCVAMIRMCRCDWWNKRLGSDMLKEMVDTLLISFFTDYHVVSVLHLEIGNRSISSGSYAISILMAWPTMILTAYVKRSYRPRNDYV